MGLKTIAGPENMGPENRGPEKIGNGQYNLPDKKQIKIMTKRLKPGWIAIHIVDNGPGIAPEIQSRVFDPFFTTKPIGQGTGLGLAICYQIIVEAHQGQLYLNSALQHGTEFIIEIPMEQTSIIDRLSHG